MPRQLRIEFEGATYHLLNRGDRREDIFWDDSDRKLFLDTLGEVCEKTNWQIHAYCLMRNHFHLVVETPHPNLVAGMHWFCSTYTARFNRRHKLFGHLFSGRYKSLLVDTENGDYFRTVCNYVHLNPARARLLKRTDALRSYRWSSFPFYLKSPSQRPCWLRADRLLGAMDIAKDDGTGRRKFETVMEENCRASPNEIYVRIRRGWYFGIEAFRKRLLEHIAKPVTESHLAVERREADMQRAERIVREELGKIAWGEGDLLRHRKGDPRKLAIACRLRRETPLNLKWIAARLHAGTGGSLANYLHCYKKK